MNKLDTRNASEKLSLAQVRTQMEQLNMRYADPFDGILKYDKAGRNLTLWTEQDFPLTLQKIQEKADQIHQDVQAIEKLKTQLQSSQEDPILLPLYLSSLSSKQDRLLMLGNALRLEAEKSGFPISDELRKEKQAQVLHFQQKIYGNQVSETPAERDTCMSHLTKLFEKKKEKLNPEESQLFASFLQEMTTKYGNPMAKTSSPTPKAKVLKGEKTINSQQMKHLSHQIMDFYKSYFKSPELMRWQVTEQANTSALNISGTDEVLNIPEQYETTNHNKVTQTIIGHEIEQHLLHWVNSNKLVGTGFTSGQYDFISEGVAKFNEDIANGKLSSFEELPLLKEGVSPALLAVFICENLSFDDAIALLKCYFKMKGSDDQEASKKALTSVQRRKRFVARDLPGSSIKDTLYQRGKNRVIDYLMEEWTLEWAVEKYKNLNILKVWPEELHFINQLKQSGKFQEEELVLPLFLGRILADKLTHGIGSAKNYLPALQLNRKNLDYQTKKQLIHILQQLKP